VHRFEDAQFRQSAMRNLELHHAPRHYAHRAASCLQRPRQSLPINPRQPPLACSYPSRYADSVLGGCSLNRASLCRVTGLLALLASGCASCAAQVSATQDSIGFDIRVTPEGEGLAVLTNRGKTPVTAYLFQVLREPCNPIEADRLHYAGRDALAALGALPLPPAATRSEPLGASTCNKDGVSTPIRAVFKAALFETGVYGERYWIVILRAHRKLRLRQWSLVSTALHSAGSGTSRSQALALLEAAQAAANPEAGDLAPVRFSDPDPLEAIRALLRNPRGPSPAHLFSLAEKQRQILAAALGQEPAPFR
jgi:hypothetical protein